MNKTSVIAILIVAIIVVAGFVVYFYNNQNTASKTPSDIVIGMPYASSGKFAFSSQAVKSGLNMWVNETNSNGGIYVSSYGKNMSVKMVYLDDQSSTSQVATDYTNLITQDNVNILLADFGSTLTAPGIPIAKNHNMVLFDTTGSTPTFFNASNPYIVDLAIQDSALWPMPLAEYLVANHAQIPKVAILYTTQDFPTAQAQTVDNYLTAHGDAPVYFQGTADASSSDYQTTLTSMNSTYHPNAVLEFGYNSNDIAFFSAISAGHFHFNMTFTIYGGLETANVASNTPAGSLNNTWTYAAPPYSQYSNVTIGPTTSQFVAKWQSAMGSTPNLNDIAGYNVGLLLGHIITKAGSLSQTALRAAANASSGITTLEGQFLLNKTTGAQIGESMNLMQFQANSTGLHPTVIYPTSVANGTAIYPAVVVAHSNVVTNKDVTLMEAGNAVPKAQFLTRNS